MSDESILDNIAWNALDVAPSTVGDPANGRLARRYATDVAPFAGVHDDADDEAWAALAALAGPGAGTVVFAATVSEPAGWTRLTSIPCHRMVSTGPFDAPEVDVEELGAADVDDMLALVALTVPGPFMDRTIELGAYLGVRVDGELVAMGGERMRPTGWSEMSAICTHPDHQRRGYSRAIVRGLVDVIEARGDRAFLHVAQTNTGAIAAYEALGFTTTAEMDVAILTAPD